MTGLEGNSRQLSRNSRWILDTGASIICTNEFSQLTIPVPIIQPISIGSALGASTTEVTHVGVGYLQLPVYGKRESVQIPFRLHYAPKISLNIVPAQDLTPQGFFVVLSNDCGWLMQARLEQSHDANPAILHAAVIQHNRIPAIPRDFLIISGTLSTDTYNFALQLAERNSKPRFRIVNALPVR